VVKLSEFLRTTRYLKPGDVKDGDVLEIVSEGAIRPPSESKLGRETFEVDVRLPSGEVKTWTVNKTTLKRLAEAYGDDTRGWVGRKVRVAVQTVMVMKEPRQAIFGYPVVTEEEARAQAIRQFLEDVRKLYPERVEASFLVDMMRKVRGIQATPEEVARAAGLRLVEEGGRRYVYFR